MLVRASRSYKVSSRAVLTSHLVWRYLGYSAATSIEAAGTFLLHLLGCAPEEYVDYSSFYNGREETQVRLAGALCDDPNMLNDFIDPGCIYIDHAVDQFEDAGFLERTWLETLLVDGHPDYRISLTSVGLAFLESGLAYDYRPYE